MHLLALQRHFMCALCCALKWCAVAAKNGITERKWEEHDFALARFPSNPSNRSNPRSRRKLNWMPVFSVVLAQNLEYNTKNLWLITFSICHFVVVFNNFNHFRNHLCSVWSFCFGRAFLQHVRCFLSSSHSLNITFSHHHYHHHHHHHYHHHCHPPFMSCTTNLGDNANYVL